MSTVPTTLGQALDADAIRYVLSLRGLRFNDSQIQERLRQQFSGLQPESARAILRRADLAQGAAFEARLAPSIPLTAADVQRPRPGCTRWRYNVLVRYTLDSGHYGTFPMTITRDASQSLDQIRAIATQNVTDWNTQQAGNANPNYPSGTGLTVQDVETYSIERSC